MSSFFVIIKLNQQSIPVEAIQEIEDVQVIQELQEKEEPTFVVGAVFPESSMRQLTFSDLYELLADENTNLFDVALNEIYKRQEMPQLNADEQFNVQVLQGMKKLKAKTDCFDDEVFYRTDTYRTNAKCYEINQAIYIDLNGDQQDESICVEYDEAHALWINNECVLEEIGNTFAMFGIVDLDEADGIKEIAISQYGSSYDYTTSFYRYTEESIECIGTLEGLIDYGLGIDGRRNIMSRQRSQLLQTWYVDVPYLYEQGEFKKQDTRYVAHHAVLTVAPIHVMTSPKLAESDAVIQPFEVVELTLTDDKKWCQMTTDLGKNYWLEIKDYNVLPHNSNQEAYEVLWGLNYSD